MNSLVVRFQCCLSMSRCCMFAFDKNRLVQLKRFFCLSAMPLYIYWDSTLAYPSRFEICALWSVAIWVITLSWRWSILRVCSSSFSVMSIGPLFLSIGKLCIAVRCSMPNGAAFMIIINVEVLHSAQGLCDLGLCVCTWSICGKLPFHDFNRFGSCPLYT